MPQIDSITSPQSRPPELEPASSPWRWLGVAAFLTMALFWIWIFAKGGGSIAHNDEMVDTTFAVAAEPICAEAQADILAIPGARTADSFDVRADQIELVSARLDTMIADLAEVPFPPDAEEARITSEWLVDYEQFTEDRRAYADRLRSGDDGPITYSARDGKRITNYLVTFAEVNNMISCVPPGDA